MTEIAHKATRKMRSGVPTDFQRPALCLARWSDSFVLATDALIASARGDDAADGGSAGTGPGGELFSFSVASSPSSPSFPQSNMKSRPTAGQNDLAIQIP